MESKREALKKKNAANIIKETESLKDAAVTSVDSALSDMADAQSGPAMQSTDVQMHITPIKKIKRTIRKSLYLSPKAAENLKAVSDANGISENELINQLLEQL